MGRIWTALGIAVVAGAVAFGAAAATEKTKLSLVAYSTPKDAYGKIIKEFQATSAGTKWNILAAYGAQRKLGKSDKQAVKYLRNLFVNHVPVQDKSAREALQTFTSGKGDVLLTYENEAIYANKKGQKTDYVIPRQTVLIESPVAATKTGAKHKEAKAFVNFLRTPRAQAIFANQGYRSVIASITRSHGFRRPAGLFTGRKLGFGGWGRVDKRFFDPSNGIMARIEREVGH